MNAQEAVLSLIRQLILLPSIRGENVHPGFVMADVGRASTPAKCRRIKVSVLVDVEKELLESRLIKRYGHASANGIINSTQRPTLANPNLMLVINLASCIIARAQGRQTALSALKTTMNKEI